MKATKKLIPTIVLLLISAVMFSTASYAWFAINETAEVTGLQIGAKTSTNLFVKGVGDATTDYNTSKAIVIAAGDAKTVLPTHADTTTLNAIKWAAKIGTSFTDGTEKADDSDNKEALTLSQAYPENSNYVFGQATDVNTNGRWVGEYFFLKVGYELYAQADKDKTLTVESVTFPAIAATNQDLFKSLRVLVVGENGFVLAQPDADGGKVDVTGTKTITTALNTNKENSTAPAKGAGSLVDVYVYFDGADTTNNKASNYIATLAEGIQVTFGMVNRG